MSKFYFKKRRQVTNRQIKYKPLLVALSTLTILFVVLRFQYNSNSIITVNSKRNDFTTSDIKAIPYEIISKSYENIIRSDEYKKIDWNQYAYATYSTNIAYLKSAVINAKRLRDHKVKADIVILYVKPESKAGVKLHDDLIRKSESKYGIKFIRVDALSYSSKEGWWKDGFTKFHVFQLTQYKKVIYFDADCIFYNKADELFLTLPEAMIYAPANHLAFRKPYLSVEGESITREERERSLEKIHENSITTKGKFDLTKLYYNLPSIKSSIDVLDYNNNLLELGNYFFVLEPNKLVFQHLIELCKTKTEYEYDMDIFNKMINLSETVKNNVFKIDQGTSKPFIMILPHNPYGLISGEFKYFEDYHECYLKDPQDLVFSNSNYTENDLLEAPYWSYNVDPNMVGSGWQSNKVFKDAKSIHFSDYPVSKPWEGTRKSIMKDLEEELRLKCKDLKYDEINRESCKGIDIWFKIYQDFENELKKIHLL